MLTNSFIFAGPTAAAPTTFSPSDPRAAQQALSPPWPPIRVTQWCLASTTQWHHHIFPAQTCAGALQTGLTVSPVTGLTPVQTAINNYLINQFETNGGLFNYNTREYLASARLDHHFNDANQVSLEYSYGHDLEESPDVQSLTGFSAGSSIHNYDTIFWAPGSTNSVPRFKTRLWCSGTTKLQRDSQ